MQVSGFFQCECGKTHSLHGITITTECTCGRKLMGQSHYRAGQMIQARADEISKEW